MPNHKIANATSSMLDMSPLKDLLGRTLTLKAKEEREVDDKTFHDDIVQRVMRAGWVHVVKPVTAEPAPAPEAPPPPAEPPALETPPAEPPALETPLAEVLPEVAPPAETMPVETPVVTETPASSSNKVNKNRK